MWPQSHGVSGKGAELKKQLKIKNLNLTGAGPPHVPGPAAMLSTLHHTPQNWKFEKLNFKYKAFQKWDHNSSQFSELWAVILSSMFKRRANTKLPRTGRLDSHFMSFIYYYANVKCVMARSDELDYGAANRQLDSPLCGAHNSSTSK